MTDAIIPKQGNIGRSTGTSMNNENYLVIHNFHEWNQSRTWWFASRDFK